MLSGEPIASFDLNQIKNKFSAACGLFFVHEQMPNLNLNFMFNLGLGPKLDKRNPYDEMRWPENYIPSKKKWDNKLIIRNLFENTKNNKTLKYFFNYDFINYYIKNHIINLSNDNIFWIKTMDHFHIKRHKQIDLTNRFIGAGNGFIDSILCLIYMGFKKIYILGAGYTYKPNYLFHFYTNFSSPLSLGKNTAIKNGKMFIHNYNNKFGTNIEFNGLKKINNYYRGVYIKNRVKSFYEESNANILNKYAKDIGVSLINIMPDEFESPIFERFSYKEFKN